MNYNVERPVNDVNTIRAYAPKSVDRLRLEEELKRQRESTVEVPLVIGGREVRTGQVVDVVSPHDTRVVLARAHLAGPEELREAAESAVSAPAPWGRRDG